MNLGLEPGRIAPVPLPPRYRDLAEVTSAVTPFTFSRLGGSRIHVLLGSIAPEGTDPRIRADLTDLTVPRKRLPVASRKG